MSRAHSYISPRSQTRVGVGKPSFLRLTMAGGTTPSQRLAHGVLGRVDRGGSFRSTGMVAATSKTSRSRNGTRTSSECAIDIRSALTRMSPRSQV